MTARIATLFILAGMWFTAVHGQTHAQQSDWFSDSKIHHSGKVDWQSFDEHSGKVQFVAGAGYFGSTLAYFRKGSDRLLYGFNLDLLPMATGNDLVSDYYNAGLPVVRQTSMLMPFWMSLKFRLTNRPASAVSPYVIAGLGPALALHIDNSRHLFDSLTSLNADLGGGGFVGVGVDYLWAESWAISADVRYMAIDFDSPLRFSEDYSGLSFAIGFIRAFGN